MLNTFSTSTCLLQSSSPVRVFMLTNTRLDANQDLDGNWQVEQPEIFRCGSLHFSVDQRAQEISQLTELTSLSLYAFAHGHFRARHTGIAMCP